MINQIKNYNYSNFFTIISNEKKKKSNSKSYCQKEIIKKGPRKKVAS